MEVYKLAPLFGVSPPFKKNPTGNRSGLGSAGRLPRLLAKAMVVERRHAASGAYLVAEGLSGFASAKCTASKPTDSHGGFLALLLLFLDLKLTCGRNQS